MKCIDLNVHALPGAAYFSVATGLLAHLALPLSIGCMLFREVFAGIGIEIVVRALSTTQVTHACRQHEGDSACFQPPAHH